MPQIDLSQLALDRSPRGVTTPVQPRRKRWMTRYALPVGVLMGFVGLLGAAAGRGLLPSQSVTVVPVIVKRADVQQAGTTLFQSPGWIEPRPTAINVAALAPGVIEELLVVEGQQVSKGEPIARLISIDSELNVQQANHSLAIRTGELNQVRAELKAATTRREHPLHLQVQVADAESSLANAMTELAKLPFLLEAAEAQLNFTRSSLDGKQSAQGAVAARIVEQAVSEHASAEADFHELQQRGPHLQREVDALKRKVDALRQQLELLVEETRQVEEAKAKVQSAEALQAEAQLQVRLAELALQRNVIRAPMQGRIMRLLASPGTRVSGLDSSGGQSSSTVVEMYDPARLQVRADVRLEDVPMVTRGQPVEIETASSKVVIRGRVLQATSSANIQKNTLEVKVELIDPPSTVSPEMLVTATFLAPPLENANSGATQTERLFVPEQLVRASDSGACVWIVDSQELAQRRSVETGVVTEGGLIEIKSGLNVTDKLIASGIDGVSENGPVSVTGDDQAIGF